MDDDIHKNLIKISDITSLINVDIEWMKQNDVTLLGYATRMRKA